MIDNLSGRLQKYLAKQLQQSLHHYLSAKPERFIIQIGANDGETFDPVKSYLSMQGTKAVLVEPVPYLFEMLKIKFKANKSIEIRNEAVVPNDHDKQLPFYYFKPKAGLPFNAHYSLWGSFSREHVGKFKHLVSHFDDLLVCENIPCISVNQLLSFNDFPRVDLLQIDVEGLDAQLVDAIDLQQCRPVLIRFEHLHSNRQHVFSLLAKMENAGYQTFSHGFDTICVHTQAYPFYRKLNIIKKWYANWLMPSKIIQATA